MTSLYPDRVEIDCPICHCRHWKPGRCFAADEVGWPIVQAAQRRQGSAARMTGGDIKRAVKGPRVDEGRKWWAS